MKEILTEWRKFINEQEKKNLGAYVKSSGGEVSVALVDLDKIKADLANSKDLKDFANKIQSKDFYKDSVLGFIQASPNKYLAKASPSMGGSGGECADTWSVKQSIGRGFGSTLYSVLLGWAAENDVYLAADRSSLTGADSGKAAAGVWKKIDNQTNDEVPFDDYENPKTEPKDDDCKVYGVDYLDKGYKDPTNVEAYKKLTANLANFFASQVEPMMSEPTGFFGKLFGSSKSDKAEKIKAKLINVGQQKFIDYMTKVG